MIQDVEGTPINKQKILFDAKSLENGRTLSDYFIENFSILHLAYKLRGGCGSIKFNSLSSEIEGDLTLVNVTEMNKHELGVDGVNLVAICENQACRIKNITQYL